MFAAAGVKMSSSTPKARQSMLAEVSSSDPAVLWRRSKIRRIGWTKFIDRIDQKLIVSPYLYFLLSLMRCVRHAATNRPLSWSVVGAKAAGKAAR